MRPFTRLFALVAALIVLGPVPAAAGEMGAAVVVAGPVYRVESAGDLVAVVRETEVLLLDQNGRRHFRIGLVAAEQSSPAALAAPTPAEQVRERILDFYNVPSGERDSYEAEDLIDEELTLAERRRLQAEIEGRATTGAGAITPLLAATPQAIWIATAEGLWLAEGGQPPRRVGPRPSGLSALAAGKGFLVAAVGADLLASADNGLTFHPIERLSAPASHVAMDSSGRWLAWVSAGALTVVSSTGLRTTWPLPALPRDLRACGQRLLLLTEDGLYVRDPERPPERTLAAQSANRLACQADGSGIWVAAGVAEGRLLESQDAGRTWHARAHLPPLAVFDAALGPDRLWVATPVGLLSVTALPDLEGQLSLSRAAQAQGGDELPRLRTSVPRWAFLLPRVALQGNLTKVAHRRDFRALAVAEFPLGTRLAPRAASRRASHLRLTGAAQAEATLDPEDPIEQGAPPERGAVSLAADLEGPCLAQTRHRAVAAALAEPERARSYVERARRSAWLPDLRLRVERRLGRTESLKLLNPLTSDLGPLGLGTVDDVRYEARASWDLGRLVFSPEEMAAETQALRMADMRREIQSQVNRLYFERRRLLAEFSVETPTDLPRRTDPVRRAIRVEELEAELDALSGGAFSRCRRAPEYNRP
jgi:hypothetical protein